MIFRALLTYAIGRGVFELLWAPIREATTRAREGGALRRLVGLQTRINDIRATQNFWLGELDQYRPAPGEVRLVDGDPRETLRPSHAALGDPPRTVMVPAGTDPDQIRL